jgi:hypothetical protein
MVSVDCGIILTGNISAELNKPNFCDSVIIYYYMEGSKEKKTKTLTGSTPISFNFTDERSGDKMIYIDTLTYQTKERMTLPADSSSIK